MELPAYGSREWWEEEHRKERQFELENRDRRCHQWQQGPIQRALPIQEEPREELGYRAVRAVGRELFSFSLDLLGDLDLDPVPVGMTYHAGMRHRLWTLVFGVRVRRQTLRSVRMAIGPILGPTPVPQGCLQRRPDVLPRVCGTSSKRARMGHPRVAASWTADPAGPGASPRRGISATYPIPSDLARRMLRKKCGRVRPQ